MTIKDDNTNATAKIENIFADIRVTPEVVGDYLTQAPLAIQERVFEFSLAFLASLSVQHKTGAYLNGNFELAKRACDIREAYTNE